jgi:hypothetical protein
MTATLEPPAQNGLGDEEPLELDLDVSELPPAKTNRMVYKFQIFAREFSDGKVGERVPPFDIEAQTKGQAHHIAEAMGLKILVIGPGRPVIPQRNILIGRDEIAAYFGLEKGGMRSRLEKLLTRLDPDDKTQPIVTKRRLDDLADKIGLQIREATK